MGLSYNTKWLRARAAQNTGNLWQCYNFHTKPVSPFGPSGTNSDKIGLALQERLFSTAIFRFPPIYTMLRVRVRVRVSVPVPYVRYLNADKREFPVPNATASQEGLF